MIIQVVAIIACNLLLVSWYKYAFALGEFLIGSGEEISFWHSVRYVTPLVLIVISLAVIGWIARRSPFVQPALAIMYLFILLGADLGRSDWYRIFLAYVVLYCIALTIAIAVFALKRWHLSRTV